MKKPFTLAAVIVGAALTLGGMMTASTTAFADDTQTIPLQALNTSPSGSASGLQGWNNVFYVGGAENSANPAIWHLVYPNGDITNVSSMQITFSNGTKFDWTSSMGLSTNGGGNNPSWIIMAPGGWTIASGWLVTSDFAKSQGNTISFNISSWYAGKPDPTGSLKYAAEARWQYQLDTTTEVWQKILQPMWQKTLQPYVCPAFAKSMKTINDTLVTRLTYSNDSATAVPTNGGAFGNGHTYVKIPATGSKTFEIADSSMNSNGKKTPSQYNMPVGFTYTVTIENGRAVITFPKDLISASVGAYIVGVDSVPSQPNSTTANGNGKGAGGNNDNGKGNVSPVDTAIAGRFPGNAPSHQTITAGGSISVPLPAQADNGYYYLYVHIASLSWYSTPYQFVGWKSCPDHPTAVVSDKWVRDDDAGKQMLSSEVETTYVDDGAYIDPVTVTVTGPNGYSNTETFTTGLIGNTLTGLRPGSYTVTVSGADFDSVTKTVTVTAGATATVDFGKILATRADIQTATVIEWVAPMFMDKMYLDPVMLPAIRLGSDTDWSSEYAIFIN